MPQALRKIRVSTGASGAGFPRHSGAGLPREAAKHSAALAAAGRDATALDAVDRSALEPSELATLKRVGCDGRRAFFRARAAAAKPAALPGTLADAIGSAVSRDGRVAALPRSVPLLHRAQKGVAGSAMRDATNAWLRSEAGKVWLEERRQLFLADDTQEV